MNPEHLWLPQSEIWPSHPKCPSSQAVLSMAMAPSCPSANNVASLPNSFCHRNTVFFLYSSSLGLVQQLWCQCCSFLLLMLKGKKGRRRFSSTLGFLITTWLMKHQIKALWLTHFYPLGSATPWLNLKDLPDSCSLNLLSHSAHDRWYASGRAQVLVNLVLKFCEGCKRPSNFFHENHKGTWTIVETIGITEWLKIMSNC